MNVSCRRFRLVELSDKNQNSTPLVLGSLGSATDASNASVPEFFFSLFLDLSAEKGPQGQLLFILQPYKSHF